VEFIVCVLLQTIKQMATLGLLGPNSQSLLKVIDWLSNNGQNVTSGLVNFLNSTSTAMKFVSSLLEVDLLFILCVIVLQFVTFYKACKADIDANCSVSSSTSLSPTQRRRT
jgi:preprotein translocase subunit SecG